MIKTFSDKHTKELFETGKSKKVPSDVLSRAIRKLEYVNLATCLDDLKVPPGNRLHQLSEIGKDNMQSPLMINGAFASVFGMEMPLKLSFVITIDER